METEKTRSEETKFFVQQLATLLEQHNMPSFKPKEGYRYLSQYHYLLANAKVYEPREMTGQERDILAKTFACLNPSPRVKECYLNALNLVVYGHSQGMVYAEGYGLHVIPTNHAWVDLNGFVVDVTWREGMGLESLKQGRDTVDALMARVEHNAKRHGYFGFTVPYRYLNALALNTGTAGSVLDDWTNAWPLLRDDFNFETYKFAKSPRRRRRVANR